MTVSQHSVTQLGQLNLNRHGNCVAVTLVIGSAGDQGQQEVDGCQLGLKSGLRSSLFPTSDHCKATSNLLCHRILFRG